MNFTPKFLYKEKLINKTVEVKTMKDYIHDFTLILCMQNINGDKYGHHM